MLAVRSPFGVAIATRDRTPIKDDLLLRLRNHSSLQTTVKRTFRAAQHSWWAWAREVAGPRHLVYRGLNATIGSLSAATAMPAGSSLRPSSRASVRAASGCRRR